MGTGWGAAGLVAGMAIVVVIGLVLVAEARRPGRVWPATAAAVLGLAVVAATAWLIFAPVTYDGPDGSVTCHSPTTADRTTVGQDEACRAPAVQRRWLVFVPLGVVGAGALAALLLPGLRPGRRRQAASTTEEEVGTGAGESLPRATSAAKPTSQNDQPT